MCSAWCCSSLPAHRVLLLLLLLLFLSVLLLSVLHLGELDHLLLHLGAQDNLAIPPIRIPHHRVLDHMQAPKTRENTSIFFSFRALAPSVELTPSPEAYT
jgi:hypothetical protein